LVEPSVDPVVGTDPLGSLAVPVNADWVAVGADSVPVPELGEDAEVVVDDRLAAGNFAFGAVGVVTVGALTIGVVTVGVVAVGVVTVGVVTVGVVTVGVVTVGVVTVGVVTVGVVTVGVVTVGVVTVGVVTVGTTSRAPAVWAAHTDVAIVMAATTRPRADLRRRKSISRPCEACLLLYRAHPRANVNL
jgi:hypothetical protein